MYLIVFILKLTCYSSHGFRISSRIPSDKDSITQGLQALRNKKIFLGTKDGSNVQPSLMELFPSIRPTDILTHSQSMNDSVRVSRSTISQLANKTGNDLVNPTQSPVYTALSNWTKRHKDNYQYVTPKNGGYHFLQKRFSSMGTLNSLTTHGAPIFDHGFIKENIYQNLKPVLSRLISSGKFTLFKKLANTVLPNTNLQNSNAFDNIQNYLRTNNTLGVLKTLDNSRLSYDVQSVFDGPIDEANFYTRVIRKHIQYYDRLLRQRLKSTGLVTNSLILNIYEAIKELLESHVNKESTELSEGFQLLKSSFQGGVQKLNGASRSLMTGMNNTRDLLSILNSVNSNIDEKITKMTANNSMLVLCGLVILVVLLLLSSTLYMCLNNWNMATAIGHLSIKLDDLEIMSRLSRHNSHETSTHGRIVSNTLLKSRKYVATHPENIV